MGDTGIREVTLRVRKRSSARRGRVRYRTSYVPVTIQQNLASRAWGTLLFGWEENTHGMEVEIGRIAGAETGRDDGRPTPLEVVASLPIGNLELAPIMRAALQPRRQRPLPRRAPGSARRRQPVPPQHLDFELNVPVRRTRDRGGPVHCGPQRPAPGAGKLPAGGRPLGGEQRTLVLRGAGTVGPAGPERSPDPTSSSTAGRTTIQTTVRSCRRCCPRPGCRCGRRRCDLKPPNPARSGAPQVPNTVPGPVHVPALVGEQAVGAGAVRVGQKEVAVAPVVERVDQQ